MLASQWMSKWKKNQIFEAIQGVGLNPKDFDFEDGDAGVRINHQWSESYFTIGRNGTSYVGCCVVGDGQDWPYQAYSQETTISRESGWLEEVKRDLETPELAAELQYQADLLGGSSNEVRAVNDAAGGLGVR